MNTSYQLKRVCGSVYSNGNAVFSVDGNSVISPVGNQVSIFLYEFGNLLLHAKRNLTSLHFTCT